MGIIKKDKFIEKGTVFLEDSPADFLRSVRTESPREMVEEHIEITPEELPILGPMQEKANRIIASAERQAQTIVESSYNEVERMKDEGRRLGLEDGKREGIKQATSQFSESMDTINQAIVARRKIIKDAESEILRLSLKVAEQILRSEVSLHRDVCLNIVSEAIARISDREQIIIRVNRDDAEHIKKYKDRIAGIVDGVKSLTILEDSHVEPGGAVIETNLGYVDARISTKLKAIEQAFRKVQERGETS